MVQQSQFRGSPMEDPNLHLSVFLEVCGMLKINGASTDVIRLRLFLFSLRDKARAWLHSLPPGSISTWDKLTKAFLAKFSHLARRRAWGTRSRPLPKERMSPCMRHESGSKICWGYAPSRTPKVDGGPDVLQWGDSTCALDDLNVLLSSLFLHVLV